MQRVMKMGLWCCVICIACGAILLSGFRVAAADDKAAGSESLSSIDVFAPFLGEWEITAHWDSGSELKARSVCEWGLNHKHLVDKTFVQGPQGEYQRYESIFSMNSRKKTLSEYVLEFDGSVSEHRVESVDGKTFKFGFMPWDAEDPANLRQTIVFKGKDAYVWTAEIREGDKWKRIIEGTWTRKSK